MFLIRGIGIAISFLYVPLLLHALDTTEYGIWLTLTSLVSWIVMFDIGLGNGLRNKLGEALAKQDFTLGKELISTAYACILPAVIIISLIFVFVYRFIPWTEVLNTGDVAIPHLNSLVLIVFLAFCGQFALGLINSILFALQLPALSSGLLVTGQLLSYLAVLLLVKFLGINSLFILGSVISIIPPMVLLTGSIVVFSTKYRYLRPSIKLYNKVHVLSIFSIGIKFFYLQIITLVLYQTNNLIISHCVNNSAVVYYNVGYKLTHFLQMVFGIIVTPIWSATTEAYTLGDFQWIKSINKKLLKIALIFVMAGAGIVAVYPLILKIWLGNNDLDISYITISLLLLQSLFFIFYQCYGFILSGIGKLKVQMIFTSLLAVLYIPVSIALGKLMGLNGILIAFALNSALNIVWAKIQYDKLMNRTAKGIWAQ